MKKSYIIIAALLIVLIYIILPLPKEESSQSPQNTQPPHNTGPPQGYTEYSKRLHWTWNDVDEALETARKENKLVLVDFWASWCGWCAKADREVFPNERVEDIILTHFLPVKVDTDVYPQTQMKYGVRGLPTIVILDGEGNIKGRIVGFRQVDEFVTLLMQYVGG